MPDIVINNGLGVSIAYSGVSKVAFRSAENVGQMVEYGYGLPANNPLKTFIESGPAAVISNFSSLTRVCDRAFMQLYPDSIGPIISMPYCSYIGDQGFDYNFYAVYSGVAGFHLPEVTYLGASALARNINCSYLYMPKLETIGSYAFVHLSGMRTGLSISTLKTIGHRAFAYYGSPYYGTASSYAMSFPACTNIGSSAFEYCSWMTHVDLPAMTYLPSYCFGWCDRLSETNFSNVQTTYYRAFYSCLALSNISLPNCKTLGQETFFCCASLNTITIGTSISTVATLYNSSVFSGTAITSTGGQIYVPSSLLTAYQSAAGWSYFSAIIHGV